MYLPNLKTVALPVPEIIQGVAKKFRKFLSTLCLRKKRTNFETIQLEIPRSILMTFGRNIHNAPEQQFFYKFAFLSTFRLSNRTLNITRISTLYQANAPTLIRCNFLKHIPKLRIFCTYNLHTFRHNTLINELLLMQFYLFNIRPKLHHHKLRKLRVTVFRFPNFLNFTSSLLMMFFVQL